MPPHAHRCYPSCPLPACSHQGVLQAAGRRQQAGAGADPPGKEERREAGLPGLKQQLRLTWQHPAHTAASPVYSGLSSHTTSSSTHAFLTIIPPISPAAPSAGPSAARCGSVPPAAPLVGGQAGGAHSHHPAPPPPARFESRPCLLVECRQPFNLGSPSGGQLSSIFSHSLLPPLLPALAF
jgi:hypothetical protein